MDRRTGAVAALALALALAAGVARADGEEDDAKPAPKEKAPLSAAELEARLNSVRVTVDWKDFAVLDAINEVQQKSGVRFFFDQALADWAGKRKVSFDGYSVTVREALDVLARAGGFSYEPDPAAQVIALKMDPAFPTRVALDEKRLSVAWREAPVSKAIADIEKKTGLKIDLHETMRSRLSKRKVSWEAEHVTAKEAIETLYVYPPPSVPARLEPKAGNRVLILYTGPPETKADIELALDDRKIERLQYAGTPLWDVVKFLAELTKIKLELDPKLIKEGGGGKVTVNLSGVTIRAALDAVSKSAGVVWAVKGSKIVFSGVPAPPP